LRIYRAIFTVVGFSLCFFYLGCTASEITQLAPSISQVSPQTIPAGTSSVTISVTGTNFTNQAVILWNGSQLATSMAGATTLTASVQGGTLATPGTAHVQVQDAQTGAASQTLPVTIAPLYVNLPPVLAILTSTLPAGVAGLPYSQSLAVTGGTAALTWSLTAGALPGGVTLSAATGLLSGTPTASGTFRFSVSVVDSGAPQQTATVALTLAVAAPKLTLMAIEASPITTATVGQAYSAAFTATGGSGPYTWTFGNGSLPAGLGLSAATGVISGTPTVSGVSSFNLTATDSALPQQSVTVPLQLEVASGGAIPLAIRAAALPAATVGKAYSAGFSASGGGAPYVWSVSMGSLPAGLTLSAATGTISGTPSAAETGSFAVGVADSSSPAQTATASAAIAVAPAALTVAGSQLASGTIGAAYAQAMQASGGSAPYTWALAGGALPAGITLGTHTGVVSGTPTATGAYNFSVTVTDAGSPAQTATAAAAMVIAPSALAITTTTLAAGTVGAAYSQTLAASGGTPAYRWSVSAGALPAGLTLGATTGAISGTPTASGSASFTATVTDNGTPALTTSVAETIAIAAAAPPPGTTTWYIRPDGGTRYSANATTGQCDGKHDAAYPGSGVNQPCAFSDLRYMWDDQSYGNRAWVMAGGDTVLIRGCASNANQATPAGPNCRIGWDANTGPGAGYTWCLGGAGGPYGCGNPTIPAGTASQHTRILGQNYANCSTGAGTNNAALTQIFGGFGVNTTLNLAGTQYVDVQCLEITEHNGRCIAHGSPAYPAACNTSAGPAFSDYDGNGILTTNTTANILLQDVSIHGHTNSGLQGPIGGPITLNRVNVSFNGFAGWNFDDGSATPDAAGSSITANYVTMKGNGCNEEYPIVHAFPAMSCYDLNSGGFGDSWSGQQGELDAFTCSHCQMLYNTKDGFLGPHTFIKNLVIEDSASIGNMGQQWKWTNTPNSTTTFVNNVTVGNCNRMSAPMPGAPSNYNQNLSLFCRAAGDVFSFSSNANSSVLLANNTVVAYSNTVFDMNCVVVNGCGTTPFVYTNNLILGYTVGTNSFPGANGQAPGLFYLSDATDAVVSTYNLEYGIRNGDPCSKTIVCVDPLLVSEPAQGTVPPEATMDGLDFHPSAASPAIAAGTSYAGQLASDYYGLPAPAIPTIGAVQP
jgi:Putative Ig domain